MRRHDKKMHWMHYLKKKSEGPSVKNVKNIFLEGGQENNDIETV